MPLDPLNKIKIYLKHFRTEKYFFSAMSKNFLWYFWSFEKNHISQSYAWLWFYLLFMCSMGPQLPKNYFLKFFPTLWDTLAANLVSKCQNFWLFLRKKSIFTQTKVIELNVILYKCIYSPLTVHPKFAIVFMKKGTLNDFWRKSIFKKKIKFFCLIDFTTFWY